MTDTIPQEWEKELRVLLDKIEAHPSADLSQERQRVVVLQKLISDHNNPPGA